MKKPLKIKIGRLMCLTPGCNTKVPVRRNEATGALSFPCIECGNPAYAKNDGSEHYANTMARLIPLETSQDVPKTDVPAPAKTSPKSIFNL
ncbi:hypothetical protein [Duganella vulcania]|uniref:Uncharacterized protein n=1 Tax=Duganella vulcania TaxID=2692166 RepID=A0A845GUB0_9BURK|nr:hypothetical protein [Duganella vulcania]MYM96247.1 hypothetical protein [Duganella vulcania]